MPAIHLRQSLRNDRATISETFGIERARTDGRFKKEREAWTTGVFASALS
jgi:hypothetical protein